jgi:lipid II:glycine glycyltransferase (peptidoglycan interpeptide bridge formation enzyme)
MSYKILDNTVSKELINKVINHPLQSYEWGEARKAMGIEIIRIGEMLNNVLINCFTMSLHKIPHTNYLVGYIPRSIIPSEDLLKFIKELKSKINLIFVKFEPNADYGEAISKKLVSSPHPLFPDWTQILPLNHNTEELLKKMKSKTRYNIKIAIKNGVTVAEETDNEGYTSFEKLYFDTVNRQTYHGHNREYHRIVFTKMREGAIAHILVARYKNEPLAAYELFLFKDKLYYPYGGSSANHKNTMASNLLMFEAIKFGIKNGATEFDMWGSAPPNFSKKTSWSGFTRFKEGYGTQYKRFIGSYDLILNSKMYLLYSFFYFIRDLLLRLRIL